MNALHSLVPSWLHRKDEDMPDEMAPLPPIATLPKPPEFNDDDRKKLIMSQAAGFVEEYKRDREASLKREQELQIQLTEAVLARQGDAKKIELLELDLAAALNDKAALESQVADYKHFFVDMEKINTKVKEVLASFGVQAPEKKPRKAKKSSVTIEAITPHDLP
jgi:hypothetical protein